MPLRKLPIVLAAAFAFTPIATQASPIGRAASPIVEGNENRATFAWILLALAVSVALLAVLIDNGQGNPLSP